MRDRDDELNGEKDGDDEVAEEDLVALHVIAAMLEVDGDDELAWAQREALAAVGDEALALKSRRENRERREVAERRARKRARREEDERAVREAAARVEAARRSQAAQEAAEARAQARARAERRERTRQQEEVRRTAQRQAEVRRPLLARPSPTVAASHPVTRVDRPSPPAVAERPTVAAARIARVEDTSEQRSTPVVALKEPERFLRTDGASLTGADLAGWRSRISLTQQAAADRLGVRQGTVSKAESKRGAALGPTDIQATPSDRAGHLLLNGKPAPRGPRTTSPLRWELVVTRELAYLDTIGVNNDAPSPSRAATKVNSAVAGLGPPPFPTVQPFHER